MEFLLWEKNVVLIAEDISLLTPCCEALLALLWPFCWQHIYIPVLPLDLDGVLDAPTPFLIGQRLGCGTVWSIGFKQKRAQKWLNCTPFLVGISAGMVREFQHYGQDPIRDMVQVRLEVYIRVRKHLCLNTHTHLHVFRIGL